MIDSEIVSIYSKPQQGGELPYFVGKQYGSGWLRTLARLAFPILKRIGVVAAKTAQDVLYDNKSILPSLKEHGLAEIKSVAPGVVEKVQKHFTGSGLRGKRRTASLSTINKRRRHTIFD